MEAEAPSRRRTVRRSVFFVSILVMLICVFTVLGVSQVLELGSATFFLVVVAGVVVLLCFFCALIAYARAKLISVQNINASSEQSLPVFYYLQTIHRPAKPDPVPDEQYWESNMTSPNSKEPEQCPICLCDMNPAKSAAIGLSACCKRHLHVKCAQQYFNTVRQVKCVFCRKELAKEAPVTRVTTSPLPSAVSPVRAPTISHV